MPHSTQPEPASEAHHASRTSTTRKDVEAALEATGSGTAEKSALPYGVLFPTPPGVAGIVRPISGLPFRLRPWVRGLAEICGVLLLVAGLCLAQWLPMPAASPIFERQPAFSFPEVREEVSTTRLILICILLPLGLAILMHAASLIATLYTQRLLWRMHAAEDAPLAAAYRRTVLLQHAIAFAWWLWAFAETILFVVAFTTIIKTVAAVPRPNFFATCNYAGYGSGLASGSLTSYLSATDPNVLANTGRCQNGSALRESLRSMPSGHASLAFACLGFAVLYLRAVFAVPHYNFVSGLALLLGTPLVLAAWIAISRVRDRYHTPADVAIGEPTRTSGTRTARATATSTGSSASW